MSSQQNEQLRRLKKNLKKFRLDRESNTDIAMTGREALSIELIKPTGDQAIVSS